MPRLETGQGGSCGQAESCPPFRVGPGFVGRGRLTSLPSGHVVVYVLAALFLFCLSRWRLCVATAGRLGSAGPVSVAAASGPDSGSLGRFAAGGQRSGARVRCQPAVAVAEEGGCRHRTVSTSMPAVIAGTGSASHHRGGRLRRPVPVAL
jgi:hypothetical protein